jgi:hypothetical protein
VCFCGVWWCVGVGGGGGGGRARQKEVGLRGFKIKKKTLRVHVKNIP